MGIAQTLDAVCSQSMLDTDKKEQFLRAALRERFPEIQHAAVKAILNPNHIHFAHLLLESYPHLPEDLHEELVRRAKDLMPYIRVILGSRDEASRAACCEILTRFGDPETADMLTGLLGDPSTRIKETAIQALETMVRHYLNTVKEFDREATPATKRFIEEKRPPIIRTLSLLATNYQVHQNDFFVEALIHMGKHTYTMITKILLHHSHEPIYRSLRRILISTASAEILFKLFLDRNAEVQEYAVTLLRECGQPILARDAAAFLASVPEEELQHVANRLKELYWWGAIEQAEDLTEEELNTYINVILKSPIDEKIRHQYFLHFLKSKHARIRQQALECLKNMGYPHIVELCQRALDDEDDGVKVLAGKILIKASPGEKIRILGQLTQNIRDENLRNQIVKELARESFTRYLHSFDRLDPQTREQAAKAIAKMDDEMANKLGAEVGALDPARRLKALQIIQYADMGAELKSAIMNVLQDPDKKIRAVAIQLIGLTGGADALKILMEALNDPDRRIRANAVETFEELKDPRFAALLTPFTKDPDNRVRANAIKALWTLGQREVRSELEAMLVHPDENMRLSAVWAVGEIRYEGALQVLQKVAVQEPSPRVRARILELLKELGS